MAKDAVLREAPGRASGAAMIRLATYGEEEFLTGIPGSNGEGVLGAQIETSSRAPE
jgi:hypothetical protein